MSASHGARPVPEAAARVLRLIDHAILNPDATEEDVRTACQLGADLGVVTVCVQACWAKIAVEVLQGHTTRPASVLGFPHGANTTEAKLIEAITLLETGVVELDMVMNVGWFRSGRLDDVAEEISSLHLVCSGAGVVLKVILETGYLTDEQKVEAAALAAREEADFVKTSTGFGPSGATVEDVRLLHSAVPPHVGVKAAGGICTLAQIQELVAAGASRIGTSSTRAIAAELGVEV